MFPGMNPRKMQQMMKKMGIQQVEIPATAVIIETPDKDIIITEPQVSKVNMMGQETFQVTGNVHERPKEPEITMGDIRTVMEQAGVTEELARKALIESGGDIAKAIMNLKG
jgi:nascent polypeptide-associated complex subunit alpha